MADLLEPLFRRLPDAIADAEPDTVDAVIEAEIEAFEEANRDAIGDALFIPITMAEMAGALMVAENERGQRRRTRMNAQPIGAFLGLPWQEAIDEFKARDVIAESEFAEVLAQREADVDAARDLMLEQLRERTKALVVRALEQDLTLEDFRGEFDALTDAVGVSRASPHYVSTIFRTNVQSAYGAGRFRAMTDPETADARPFVQYLTVDDLRVRPEHAKLHERVWRIDDPEWHRVAPPNGYNCRCSMVTLSAEEAAGLEIQSGRPADFEPDPGFAGPPVALT